MNIEQAGRLWGAKDRGIPENRQEVSASEITTFIWNSGGELLCSVANPAGKIVVSIWLHGPRPAGVSPNDTSILSSKRIAVRRSLHASSRHSTEAIDAIRSKRELLRV